MEHCDAATQLSFLQTSTANWALYQDAELKRPLFDVGNAIARHGYRALFDWWTESAASALELARFGSFYQPLEALVYGHYELAEDMGDLRERLRSMGMRMTGYGANPSHDLVDLLDSLRVGPKKVVNWEVLDYGRPFNDFQLQVLVPYAAGQVKVNASNAYGATALHCNLAKSKEACQLSVTTRDLFDPRGLDSDWEKVFLGLLLRPDAEKLIKQLDVAALIEDYPPIDDDVLSTFQVVIQAAVALGRAHLLPYLFREDDLYELLSNYTRPSDDGRSLQLYTLFPYLRFDPTKRSHEWLETFLEAKVTGDPESFLYCEFDSASRDFWLFAFVHGHVPNFDVPSPGAIMTASQLHWRIRHAERWRVESRQAIHKDIENFLTNFQQQPETIGLSTLLSILRSKAISRGQAERLAQLVTTVDVASYYKHFKRTHNAIEPSAFARCALVRDDAPQTSLKQVVKIACEEAIYNQRHRLYPLFDRMAKLKKWTREEVTRACTKAGRTPDTILALIQVCEPLVKDA